MILKLFKRSALSLLIFISLNPLCHADQGETDSGYLSTPSAGTLKGTPPVIQNAKGNKGKVDFTKISEHSDSEQLDEGDVVTLAWQLQDNEGDADNTLASIVWTCDHPTKGSRVLATQVNSYTISSADYGCNIGVSMQPQTATGIPQMGDAMTVPDISINSDTDNIIEGSVNTHAISITDYIVAPDTTQSKTVSADLILRTGWNGAKVQLETDNPPAEVQWSSSDNNIASVSPEGLVTFIEKGEVSITAKNNNDVETHITFNPDLFYVFSSTLRNWDDAYAWCDDQGYRLPDKENLSIATNTRQIPADALWQEWGDVSQEKNDIAGVVFWSRNQFGNKTTAYYVYLSDGHTSSNSETAKEGVACTY